MNSTNPEQILINLYNTYKPIQSDSPNYWYLYGYYTIDNVHYLEVLDMNERKKGLHLFPERNVICVHIEQGIEFIKAL